jgi:hypothetical protein
MAGDLGYLLSPTTIGYAAQRHGFGPAYVLAALPAAAVAAAALRLPNGTPAARAEPAEPEPAEPIG